MEDILNNSNNNLTPPVPDPTAHITPNPGEEFEVKSLSPADLDSVWLRWKCLNCGYVYEGSVELKKCPKCGNEDPDKFGDAE